MVANGDWTTVSSTRRDVDDRLWMSVLICSASPAHRGPCHCGSANARLCLRDRLEERLIFPRFPTEFRYFTQDVSDSGVSEQP